MSTVARSLTLRPLVLKRLLPAFPHPHFMGLAPLDVWVRMLWRGGAWRRVRARYWVRVGWCLFTSALATGVTLPERIVVGVWFWASAKRQKANPSPGFLPQGGGVKALCVLGYYRSGTTHLHYMLSCDPAMTTPRWYQVLAPQGWVVSWLFLRWFLVPFLGSTRPQDDVAIGPEWPAEDDFALCNWTLSSTLPGRMVLPREWGGWSGTHALDGVSVRERLRWRRAVVAFAWKISRAEAGRKRVILKTPSHTARVGELGEAFGAGNVKYIHIARDPAAVLRSNIAMHGRFGPYLLQDSVDGEELRRRIVEEYDATERAFLEQAANVPRGDLARIRYQDLIADPMGEMRRAYAELGLPWSEELDVRVRRYLRDVAGYRAASGEGKKERDSEALPAELSWMHAAFGHERATIAAKSVTAQDPEGAEEDRGVGLVIDTLIVALLVAAAWIGVSWVLRDRLDWMTWPAGVVIGIATMRAAGSGSVKLGVWAAGLTLGALAVVAYPATCLAFYRDRTPMPWGHVWDSTRDGLLAINNLIWLFLGVMTAYRLASRKQTRPPGE